MLDKSVNNDLPDYVITSIYPLDLAGGDGLRLFGGFNRHDQLVCVASILLVSGQVEFSSHAFYFLRAIARGVSGSLEFEACFTDEGISL